MSSSLDVTKSEENFQQLVEFRLPYSILQYIIFSNVTRLFVMTHGNDSRHLVKICEDDSLLCRL
jgi:hypothetical protein